MITLRLIGNICICIFCGLGFFHGMFFSFGKKCPLYVKAVTGAMGCMMSGRLFSIVLQLCGGTNVTRMNLGYLGIAGCFLFLYSSTRVEISEHIGKIRNWAVCLLSLISFAPIVFLGYLIIKSDASNQYKLLGIIACAVIMHCTMHFFVYLVLPDKGDGFIKMLRPYVLLALIFSYSQLGEIYFSIKENTIMMIITYAFLCLSGISLVPLLERLNKKWEKEASHESK